jgi:DNA-binding FadR family transcriptional regulator
MQAVIEGDAAKAERLARRHIHFSARTVLDNTEHEVQMSY